MSVLDLHPEVCSPAAERIERSERVRTPTAAVSAVCVCVYACVWEEGGMALTCSHQHAQRQPSLTKAVTPPGQDGRQVLRQTGRRRAEAADGVVVMVAANVDGRHVRPSAERHRALCECERRRQARGQSGAGPGGCAVRAGWYGPADHPPSPQRATRPSPCTPASRAPPTIPQCQGPWLVGTGAPTGLPARQASCCCFAWPTASVQYIQARQVPRRRRQQRECVVRRS